MWGWTESAHGEVKATEVAYYCAIMSLVLLCGVARLPLNTIISLNGAVLSFIFIYVLPCAMHVKCLYFSHNSKLVQLDPHFGGEGS